MTYIAIPKSALDGFSELIKLSPHQMKGLIEFLSTAKVGFSFKEFDSYLNKKLEIGNSTDIITTFLSFGDLIDSPGVNYEELSSDLSDSFNFNLKESLPDSEKQILKERLLLIFNSSHNLRITLKAQRLYAQDFYLFRDCKVITDIRPVFDDDIKDSNRSAMILHKFHIDYIDESRDRKSFIATLDGIDLKKVREAIDRAIDKEKYLIDDYKNVFNIITFED